jgi:hypothetical protein
LVPRPISTVGISEAALFRSIEKWEPSIFIDEADTILVENEPLRAVINSGWTRGATVLRCIGEDKEPHPFSTFAPKALGSKGLRFPDTVLSRSLIIGLKRKKSSDRAEHFRHIDDPDLADLRRKLLRWTNDNIEALKAAAPKMPPGFDNRLGDNWRLLLAVADRAGGGWWSDLAREAATVIAKVATDDTSIGVRLLADIKAIFANEGTDRISSVRLVEMLAAIEGGPWAEWKSAKAITPNGLARQLKPFAIVSDNIRIQAGVVKGYQLSHFADAFERYLP